MQGVARLVNQKRAAYVRMAIGLPISLLMSKTPRQPNRHSRYDNAQHCALSAAYKKHVIA